MFWFVNTTTSSVKLYVAPTGPHSPLPSAAGLTALLL